MLASHADIARVNSWLADAPQFLGIHNHKKSTHGSRTALHKCLPNGRPEVHIDTFGGRTTLKRAAQGLSGPDWLRDWDFVLNPSPLTLPPCFSLLAPRFLLPASCFPLHAPCSSLPSFCLFSLPLLIAVSGCRFSLPFGKTKSLCGTILKTNCRSRAEFGKFGFFCSLFTAHCSSRSDRTKRSYF